MPAWVIDVTMLFIVLIIAWSVSSEGLWGAALLFVNFMIAGLIAFCYFEPIALFIEKNVSPIWGLTDFIAVVVLFSIVFSILRLGTDMLAPLLVRFPGWLMQVGRMGFGLATGWYAAGMVLCMLETAPIHKQFLGYQWEKHAFWSVGIDRSWLGYVQWSTGRVFSWHWTRRFDRNADFIIRYHDRRPFGDPDPNIRPAASSGSEAAPAQPAAGAAQQL